MALPEAGSGGQTYARSEGIAVASYNLFVAGAFSDDPDGAPLRAAAGALERVTGASLARGLQVGDDNPMVGVEGRAAMLQRLGAAVRAEPAWGGRLGGLGVQLRQAASGTERSRPSDVLGAVLDALGSIWPGREVCAGQNLGDVWTHSSVRPRALSQAVAVAHLLALRAAGVGGGVDRRSGRPDGPRRVPERRPVRGRRRAGTQARRRASRRARGRSSDVVIEWRALTVALLDRIAERVRAHPGPLRRRAPAREGARRGHVARRSRARGRATPGRRSAPARPQRWYGFLTTWPPTSS